MFNDNIEERYALALDRIREINSSGLDNDNKDIKESDKMDLLVNFDDYFRKVSDFILMINQLVEDVKEDKFNNMTLEELGLYNKRLYEDITGNAYESSYANPSYAVSKLGDNYGQLHSFLYTEIRGMIVYGYEKRLADIVALMELFIEVYCMYCDGSVPEYRHTSKQFL